MRLKSDNEKGSRDDIVFLPYLFFPHNPPPPPQFPFQLSLKIISDC